MKKHLMRRSAVLALAAVMLTGSASALFGSKKEAAEPVAGAPTVQDLEISTYRDIPYQTQFLLASSEGDVTYAVAEEPKKGTVTISGSEFTYTRRRELPDRTASPILRRTARAGYPSPPQYRCALKRANPA